MPFCICCLECLIKRKLDSAEFKAKITLDYGMSIGNNNVDKDDGDGDDDDMIMQENVRSIKMYSMTVY